MSPKTIASYLIFVFLLVIVVVTFVTATSFAQLAIGILIYPLLVFCAYKIIPRGILVTTSNKTGQPPQVLETVEEAEPVEGARLGISDVDKRLFLKLIGGAGVFLFLYSLLNKSGENQLFKSVAPPSSVSLQDTTGQKINPAQDQPLDGYAIAEFDNNPVSFYGFIDKNGAWYVVRIDTESGSFRYSRGDKDFPGNWANRANLRYDYFSNVF